ncbi:MAG TPA: translation initiation factor IF-3 [Alphaproteobacteria bacterium]|nr:translation initiation factor IF-3 [Alphaproteobacteria bacterium]
MQTTQRVNEMIRVREVRVISPEGEQLGILPIEEALALARDRDLDLVEVAPNERPPVCRIMDFGKYKYQQAKRSQEAKKRQRVIQTKEIKMRPKTEEHDYQFKMRHARRFLEEGHKVKVSLLFRGREMDHIDLGQRMLDRIIVDCKDISAIEQQPRLEGQTLSLVLTPKS